jgi:mannose-6-phosphate isomerase-like protein (cupin superfamily)
MSVERTDLSISLLKANILSFPIVLVLFILAYIPYSLFWETSQLFKEFQKPQNLLILFSLFLVGAVIHELIHAITWMILAKIPFSNIKFGINWKSLSPYAHCSDVVTVKVYRVAIIAPFIFLGFFPLLISYLIGHEWIFIFGLLFTITAGGDFLVLYNIRKLSKNHLVQDHPNKAGCYVLIYNSHSLEVKNIYKEIPQFFDNEIFEEIVRTKSVKIERIISDGHKSPIDSWYNQKEDEYVILLQGQAELLFEENQKIVMVPGDYLVIPANKKHRVEFTSKNEKTIWLAIHYKKI